MTSADTYDINKYKIEELIEKLLEITKWHAQIQIDLFNELEEEKEIS
jgi:hypothetical protein